MPENGSAEADRAGLADGSGGQPPAVRHRRLALGALALAFYAVHAGYRILDGRPEMLLWSCHLGAVLVGAGLLLRSAAWNGAGVMWLSVGTPLWITGLYGSGRMAPTSLLTHVGALVIGLWAAWRDGVPRGTWWKALAAIVVLHLASKGIPPERGNVNLAHEVWRGFEWLFPTHLVFVASVLALCAAMFYGVEWLFRRRDGGR